MVNMLSKDIELIKFVEDCMKKLLKDHDNRKMPTIRRPSLESNEEILRQMLRNIFQEKKSSLISRSLVATRWRARLVESSHQEQSSNHSQPPIKSVSFSSVSAPHFDQDDFGEVSDNVQSIDASRPRSISSPPHILLSSPLSRICSTSPDVVIATALSTNSFSL